jgi:hypothetical protein
VNQQEKINLVRHSLKDVALGDIQKTAQCKAPVAAFVMCACLIDALAGYRYGYSGQRGVNKANYVNFVRDYLPDYNAEDLYRDLRCRLVHNFSVGDSYLLINGSPFWHQRKQGDYTLLNLENFLLDAEMALDTVLEEIETDKHVRSAVLKHFDALGGIIELKVTDGKLASTVP